VTTPTDVTTAAKEPVRVPARCRVCRRAPRRVRLLDSG
jgi:hypothetical protein